MTAKSILPLMLVATMAACTAPVTALDLPLPDAQQVQVQQEGEISCLSSASAYELEMPSGRECWAYGTNDSATWHLEQFPTPYEPARRPVGSFMMQPPYGWIVFWDAKTSTGVWIQPQVGDRVQVTAKGDKVVVQVPAKAKLLAADVSALDQGHALAERVCPQIEWEGLNGAWRGLTIRAEDRNGNGRADTKADRWHVYSMDTRKMVLSFFSKAQDPRGEADFCLISTDLNKDGKVDDEEMGLPSYKLLDIDGDGRFFEGHILQGGRLEKDAYYFYKLDPRDGGPEGSPEGMLWTHKVEAMDLDGDGDQDVTVRTSGMDFRDRALGGWGTASDREGFKIDYADRPMGELLEISAATGQVRQHKIKYDNYFYSASACATTANYMDVDGVFHVQEEHLDYDGFRPAGGEAHIWTMHNGGMHRLIYGDIGGEGKWKLGVNFSTLIDGMIPRQVCHWKTPYGQELKILSYTHPQNWDGKKLELKQVDGQHADYIYPSPMNWAFKQTILSKATIEPSDVFGERSYEAYLHGTNDRSRFEYAGQGETTFVFYHSPLMNGMHHKGATWGQSKDQKLVYFDSDADGVMDIYAYDADSDGRWGRRLWYDRAAGKVTLYDRGKVYTWEGKYEFPQTHMGLENFDELERLYRMGDADKAMVKAELPKEAQPAAGQPQAVASDVYHGGAVARWSNCKDEGGMAGLGKAMAHTQARLLELDQPFSAETLAGIDVLIISNLERPVADGELAALQEWVKAGGTLVLAPAGPNSSVEGELALGADLRAGFAMLAGTFADAALDHKSLSLDFRKLRIPDSSRVIGDVIGDKYPTPANAATNFAGEAGWHKDLTFIAAQEFAFKAAKSLLSHGQSTIVGLSESGKGRVVLAGGCVLANRYVQPPLHDYRVRSDDEPFDNFVLAQRISGYLLGAPQLPHVSYPLDKPVEANVQWRTEEMTSEVMRIVVYPEIGGRILHLGRKDSGFNHARMESPEYLNRAPHDMENPDVYGRNYGGLFDVGARDWPGLNFFDREYQVNRLTAPEVEQMTLTGEADGIEVVRTINMPREQTAVNMNITQTNRTQQPRRVMIRLTSELAATPGGVDIYWLNDSADSTIKPVKTQQKALVMNFGTGPIKKMNYILGKEEGRGTLPSTGDWVAAVHRSIQEVLLVRADKSLEKDLFYWSGAGGIECDNWSIKLVPDDYHGFYSLQWQHKPQIVAAGDSISAPLSVEVFRGLDGIDLMGKDYVGQLSLSAEVLTAQDELEIRPRIATIGATPALGASVKIADAQGKEVAARDFEPKMAEAAGLARQWAWKMPLSGMADGEYTLTMKGPDGQTGSKNIRLISQAVAQAQAALDETAQAAAAASGMAADMAQSLLEQAGKDIAARNIEAAKAKLQRVRQIIQ